MKSIIVKTLAISAVAHGAACSSAAASPPGEQAEQATSDQASSVGETADATSAEVLGEEAEAQAQAQPPTASCNSRPRVLRIIDTQLAPASSSSHPGVGGTIFKQE
jgi:hypothetical protein